MELLSNSEIQYRVGDRVWIEYLTPTRRRGIVTDISNDDVEVSFMYWSVNICVLFNRSFGISPFTCDDYFNDIRLTVNSLSIDFCEIESYVRKNKLIKIKDDSNYIKDDITEVENVLNRFDIKYIEEYIFRIKKEIKLND